MPNNKIIDLERLSRFKDKLDNVLDTKANVDGNYQTMTVGNADALTPYGENSGASDTTPFVFQSTGGSSDVGVKAYLRELRGNSVAFNQLFQTTGATETINGVTITNNNDGSFTLNGTATADTSKVLCSRQTIQGHKYLFKGCYGGSSTTYYTGIGSIVFDYGEGNIHTGGFNGTSFLSLFIKSGTVLNNKKIYPQCFDLTLLSKVYSTVLAFNRDYPKTYYDYNAGTLLSSKVNGIKNVGYNAFDGKLELGTINQTTGENQSGTSTIRTKNTIKVIAGQNYTIETVENYTAIRILEYDGNNNLLSTSVRNVAANAKIDYVLSNNTHYVRFVFAVNSVPTNPQIAFHLTWDKSRTGFEEHEERQYNLPNIELKSAGSVYDVLYSVGGGKRRVGFVDLGALTWSYSQNKFIATISDLGGTKALLKVPNIICSKYSVVGMVNVVDDINDKSITYVRNEDLKIQVKDTSYTDATTFKTAMSGVYLYYELATETDITTEENPGWQNQQDIDDFGTQEFLYDNDIDIPVPQGNEFFYPVDYKAFIDSLGGREDIEYVADQVVSQTQLTQALSTFLSSISGYDATKTQTLKNVNGVFQWVDD